MANHDEAEGPVSRFLFELPTPAVPVAGEDAFYPVRRVFCVARNYAAHAREMGGNPEREEPFYFTKPADALVLGGGEIPYPPETANLHHEIELVVAVASPLFRATAEQAAKAIFGYAVGRDKGRPWDLGKSFEFSAPLTSILRNPATLTAGAVTLTVNGQTRQTGDISDMIWSVPEVLAHLSRYYHLGAGDLIFTGTPEGVGPVVPGDRLSGTVEGVATLEVTIVADR